MFPEYKVPDLTQEIYYSFKIKNTHFYHFKIYLSFKSINPFTKLYHVIVNFFLYASILFLFLVYKAKPEMKVITLPHCVRRHHVTTMPHDPSSKSTFISCTNRFGIELHLLSLSVL